MKKWTIVVRHTGRVITRVMSAETKRKALNKAKREGMIKGVLEDYYCFPSEGFK